MTRPLSYIYPITKTVISTFSGPLEITTKNGKKHLNTKNANYSYGALQLILKFGLDKIDLKKVNSILLLGLGGGSVIHTLRDDFNFQKHVTAVDIDPVIIDIAKTEFGLENNSKLKIICQDALQYINQNTQQFDLIIIDLFIDIDVPKQFLELSFWEAIIKSKSSNGVILFNGSLEKEKSQNLKKVIAFLKSKVYKVEVYDKINRVNTLVITQSL
ncbi:fused MFS/spermidine synthase [Psychroserpens burtonensis]|uniref:fused MFS/spermidine synthase n=1 Tax=Psychroserpens burtonensis TaxID=49278 RepID=UPI0004158B91|nr:fused MFS/spermidine synthase [Psychroserpens burtonensis]